MSFPLVHEELCKLEFLDESNRQRVQGWLQETLSNAEQLVMARFAARRSPNTPIPGALS